MQMRLGWECEIALEASIPLLNLSLGDLMVVYFSSRPGAPRAFVPANPVALSQCQSIEGLSRVASSAVSVCIFQ